MNVEQIRRSLAQKAEISYEAYEQAKADLPHDEFYANYTQEYVSNVSYGESQYKYYRLIYPEAAEVTQSLLFEMLNSQKRQEKNIDFMSMVLKIYVILCLVAAGLWFLIFLFSLAA